MIGHDHFICHSYCHFSVLSHILLSTGSLFLSTFHILFFMKRGVRLLLRHHERRKQFADP